MRAEDDRRVVGDLVHALDEDRTLALQVVDDEAVVHDLVPHVDRGAALRERLLDDRDRAVDTGAEAARIGEQHLHQRFTVRAERPRKLSRMSAPAPTVMAPSATLNAG